MANRRPFIIIIDENNCHRCTSHKPNIDGYVRVYNGNKRNKFLHRIKWEKENGYEVPEGYELNHLCKQRDCCNPEHLRLIERSAHKSLNNSERYRGIINQAKEVWQNNPDITGTELGKMFGRTYATGCKWIRQWNKEELSGRGRRKRC